MSTETGHTLVPSTNRGGSALDDPQGYELTSGRELSVLLGDCWTGGQRGACRPAVCSRTDRRSGTRLLLHRPQWHRVRLMHWHERTPTLKGDLRTWQP
jgi:hypothetical protein